MTNAGQVEHLWKAIERLSENPEAFDGFCFRCVKPRYGNMRDAFSGEGSRYASGRFHVKGTFLIVYTGCTFEGANWEFTHTARSSGIDVAKLLPISTLSARVG